VTTTGFEILSGSAKVSDLDMSLIEPAERREG
jgi:hypothetical protein